MQFALDRIFTLDVRQDYLPAWNNPVFRQFVLDERNGDILVLLGHVFFKLSIDDFPGFSGSSIDSVYINTSYYDQSSGLLAIGCRNQSGNPPLKLFDTNSSTFRWVTVGVSKNYWDRADNYDRTRYGRQVDSIFVRSVDAVAINPISEQIVLSATERATLSDVDAPKSTPRHSLKALDIDGKLLKESFDLFPYCMTFNSTGERIYAASELHLLSIDPATLQIQKSVVAGGAEISSICLTAEERVAVTTSEGDILCYDQDLNLIWCQQVSGMLNCIRHIDGLGITVGTNLGDLIVLDELGNVIGHERVSESIRDIGGVPWWAPYCSRMQKYGCTCVCQ